jgi:glycosyltransferase involved in cell wall biosynthesis
MRLLIVSHPPLLPELGSAQVALNLAAALRARGHDVQAWSPPSPLPPGGRWGSARARRQRTIERFAAMAGPFDLIDTPAIAASARLARCAPLIVRSVQPELRYLAFAVRTGLRWHLSPRVLAGALGAAWSGAAVVQGWRRARTIVCLGTGELSWMQQHFRRWSAKLRPYVIAVGESERAALAGVRAQRPLPPAAGTRFLWLGRWSPHKGTRRLVRFLAARLAAARDETFTIAGCGPLAERDLRPEWLRSGRIELVPSFARAELPSLLAAHQAGLFTSEVEGWGVSLNEMLESGMPVYATAAGAVPDLLPYFPFSLRPFPPPARLEPQPLEDLEGNGYHVRFAWPEIARAYEQLALAGAAPARPR